MCGIAGMVTSESSDPDALRESVRAMLGTLAHRGPDDEHLMSDSRAAMGARRLAIIDLETGRQPVTSEDGRIWATQNGEIYNYVELRSHLRERGHQFTSSGDTEVIAHLYEDVGLDFVKHLRGMFAVSVWDQPRRRLVLARDRLGKKPLYWQLRDGRLIYGSELKAILSTDDQRVPDAVSMAQYFQYQYVPSPRTVFKNISKLEPGSILCWEGGEPEIYRYWRVNYEPKSNRSLLADQEECLQILREATQLRLRSDVPVGVFLSGGVDSSLVTALVAEASPEPVRTLTIGFDHQDFDERPHARRVAEFFGTRHDEDVVTIDAVGDLPRLIKHFDEPFGDASALATLRVAELAGDLKVVLTGDGGDEAFAGYDRYRLDRALSVVDAAPRSIRRAAAASVHRLLRAAGRRAPGIPWAELGDLTGDARYVRLMSIFGPSQRAELLGGYPSDQDSYLLDLMALGPSEGVDRLLFADTQTYLPEDMLVKVDRATMAASLEARCPLLDHVLVEFAARLPTSRKLRFNEAKVLLRRVAAGLLPPGALDRPKTGFGLPVSAWFRGDLGRQFMDLMLAPDAQSRDHIDIRVAARLLQEHASGRADHGHRLWLLLVFELWCRMWLRVPRGVRA